MLVFYLIAVGLSAAQTGLLLTLTLAGAVGVYVIQMLLSRIWLSRAQFGPAEWLWRMLTYRRRFALLKGSGPLLDGR